MVWFLNCTNIFSVSQKSIEHLAQVLELMNRLRVRRKRLIDAGIATLKFLIDDIDNINVI